MPYRFITPTDESTAIWRMLCRPADEELYEQAVESDSLPGLVAALMDEPLYEEMPSEEERLMCRMELAHSISLVYELNGQPLAIVRTDEEGAINVETDEQLLLSLEKIGYISLDPGPSLEE